MKKKPTKTKRQIKEEKNFVKTSENFFAETGVTRPEDFANLSEEEKDVAVERLNKVARQLASIQEAVVWATQQMGCTLEQFYAMNKEQQGRTLRHIWENRTPPNVKQEILSRDPDFEEAIGIIKKKGMVN